MAAIPGATRGSTIFRNSCHSVAPSTFADSSISSGSSAKNPIMYQMISVMLISTHARITGTFVFRIPSFENIVYSGIVNATGGRIRMIMIQNEIGFFMPKRNLCRARTYAVQSPIVSEIAVEISVV